MICVSTIKLYKRTRLQRYSVDTIVDAIAFNSLLKSHETDNFHIIDINIAWAHLNRLNDKWMKKQ